MTFYYDCPTQVKFKETEDASDYPRWIGGIAYRDEVICCECGSIVSCEDIEEIIDLPWVNISDEVVDDEG
jgi:hypothetical protein